MSKSPVIAAVACRRHCRWLGAALWLLAALPTAAACAASPEPALRSSQTLDIHRLGRVSDDERSVLRVEWHAAQAASDEANAVQQLLGSLRRMEADAAEIKHLVGSMPAQRPAITAIVAESTENSASSGRNLTLMGGGAAIVLSLWWLRRRNGARQSEPEPAAGIAAGEISSATVSPAKSEPVEAPRPGPARVDPSATIQLPAATAPAADVYTQTLRLEPHPAGEIPAVLPAPTPQPTAMPAPAPSPSEPPPVDFSLEDADAEFIAREKARIPVPRKPDTRRRVPERRQELHIEPTLQLAEIMLSMGLEQGAARALVEYIDANPRQAVYHWLKLLGIYRDGGHRKDFVETAGKLRKYFNIQATDAATAGAGAAPTLESFPRVADQVRALWSRPTECMAYLQHLLEDNREGSRIGFPQSVAEELLLLIEILKEVCGAGQAAAT